jgi:hypothetical protein
MAIVQSYNAATGQVVVDLGGKDFASVDLFVGAGDDAPPLSGDRVMLVAHTSDSSQMAAVGIERLAVDAEPGERILQSRDSDGNTVATVALRGDGSIELTSESATVVVSVDGIEITGDVTITGNVTVTGSIEAVGVTDSTMPPGATLGTHVHTSAAPGSPTSTPTPGT